MQKHKKNKETDKKYTHSNQKGKTSAGSQCLHNFNTRNMIADEVLDYNNKGTGKLLKMVREIHTENER